MQPVQGRHRYLRAQTEYAASASTVEGERSVHKRRRRQCRDCGGGQTRRFASSTTRERKTGGDDLIGGRVEKPAERPPSRRNKLTHFSFKACRIPTENTCLAHCVRGFGLRGRDRGPGPGRGPTDSLHRAPPREWNFLQRPVSAFRGGPGHCRIEMFKNGFVYPAARHSSGLTAA